MRHYFPKNAEIVCVSCGLEFDDYRSWVDQELHFCIAQLKLTASWTISPKYSKLDKNKLGDSKALIAELFEEMFFEQLEDIEERAQVAERSRFEDYDFVVRFSQVDHLSGLGESNIICIPNLTRREIEDALKILPENLRTSMHRVKSLENRNDLENGDSIRTRRQQALKLMENVILESRGVSSRELLEIYSIANDQRRGVVIRKALRALKRKP